jgi:putative membrane protein
MRRRFAVRWLVSWVLNALTLFGIAYFAPQVGILEGFRVDSAEAAAVAAVVIALLNVTVRPILKLLALPITCLTFGLFTLVINAVIFLVAENFVRGFVVGGFMNAVIASIVYAVVSSILNGIFNQKEDD